MTNGNTLASKAVAPTVCKLCKKTIARIAMPLDVPESGPPGDSALEYLAVLVKHMNKHHQPYLIEKTTFLGEIQAWMLLSVYEHSDESVNRRMEAIRAAIFQECRRYTFSDEKIDTLVDALGYRFDYSDDPITDEPIKQAMRSMRDILCETAENKIPDPAPRIILPM